MLNWARYYMLGWRSGLRFGTEKVVCSIGVRERMGMGSNTSAAAGPRPGAKSGQGDFFPRFRLLSAAPLLHPLHYSITAPPLHFFTIPCNLSSHFPLYGVEAGGLPAKAMQRKKLNVDKDRKLWL